MKRLLVVLALTAVLAAMLLPLDGPIAQFCRAHPLGGDLRRSLEALQQYGDLGTILVVSAVVFLLDRARRGRLLDLYLASGATFLACQVLKMLVGRPRPFLQDPWGFTGPWRAVRFRPLADSAPAYAWEFWRNGIAALWSMPSSHTAAAMALSLFLVHVYPRLRPLAASIVVVVGVGRVVTGAHYPTDLLIGALLGYVVSAPLIRGGIGERLLRRVHGDRTAL